MNYELTISEFVKLQNRYAYANKFNNYNELPLKDYQSWYNECKKLVNWNKFQ